MFEMVNVTKEYQSVQGGGKTIGIRGVDLIIETGEFISIMGKSGSGKSTLLKIMGTIDIPTKGHILINGERIAYNNSEKLTTLRRKKIGFIFQDFCLINTLSVKENIMLPMLLDGKSSKIAIQHTEKNADCFDITAILSKYPYELSGGEKQRVAICRALSNSPDIVFADEPTGNLDSYSTNIVLKSLQKLNQEYGKTVIMVTHDPLLASLGKRVVFLKDGMIEKEIKFCDNQHKFYEMISETTKIIDFNDIC